MFQRLLITVKPMEWDHQMPVHLHICMSGQGYLSMDGMSNLFSQKTQDFVANTQNRFIIFFLKSSIFLGHKTALY